MARYRIPPHAKGSIGFVCADGGPLRLRPNLLGGRSLHRRPPQLASLWLQDKGL